MAQSLVTTEAAGRAPQRKPGRVACPFCALLCGDLEAGERGPVVPAGAKCSKARDGFSRIVPSDAGPHIKGRSSSMAEALDAAAGLLTSAKAPLFGGLAADVDGVRALLEVADRTGGVVDHAFSAAALHNVNVMQTRGWVMTTLSEVRNRADLIVVIGDIGDAYPRFYERAVVPSAGMFGALNRHVALVGNGRDASLVKAAQVFPCEPSNYGAFLATLRAALDGRPPPSVAGIDAASVIALADRIRDASYAVFVWSPAKLAAADGDLVVLSLCDLVRSLNATQRAAGLSLGGNEGGATAAAVSAWTTGYPLRVSLATGKPVYDPVRNDIARMIAGGHGDALVWTAAIGDNLAPPETMMPTIVIGTPGLKLPRLPDVLIPAGTAGIDHDGDLVRTDGVVTVHLRRTRESSLLSVASIARGLLDRLAL